MIKQEGITYESLDFLDETKKRGQTIKIHQDWGIVNFYIMLEIVREKFRRHPKLAIKLIDTYDLCLIEGETHNDEPFYDRARGKKIVRKTNYMFR